MEKRLPTPSPRQSKPHNLRKEEMAPSRDLEEAKKAYRQRDIHASIAAHSAGAKERHQQEHGQYIKSAVYGGLDGIITTFAVVAGVAGAKLAAGIVLILGFANLIADGLSMAIGDYLSTKSEQEYERAERRREEWEVEHYPEGEKHELVELYTDKGIAPEDAKTIVELLAKTRTAWIDVMMVEELGILGSDESPLEERRGDVYLVRTVRIRPLGGLRDGSVRTDPRHGDVYGGLCADSGHPVCSRRGEGQDYRPQLVQIGAGDASGGWCGRGGGLRGRGGAGRLGMRKQPGCFAFWRAIAFTRPGMSG